MKEKKFSSYEEFEMREMERFIKKKREMENMSKYHEFDEYEEYGKHHDKCKCHKKHHECDDHDHGKDKDKDEEVYYCKCMKKKEKKKHPVKKHEHKHYHMHEYKHHKKDDKKDDHKKDDHKKDDHKKDEHKKHRKVFADVVDFEYDQKKPRNVYQENFVRLPRNIAFPVAEVTMEEVKAGDLVWLNGVVALDNDEFIGNTVTDIRIIKGNNFMTGEEIYHSRIELNQDGEGDDDLSIEPFSHVDKNFESAKNVKYTVTVTVNRDDVFLPGPTTLTALQIDKKRNC
ncbi:hypothetical protein QR721_05165 [Aciduricibacillus chroicocephali]|uniref:SipL SPOCS domain-containing protein n=1 Tax=Aciduricibacillus chroicocephali TaxID=3054939 RepID=A0ABY9KXV6_9BACI|nr:hypothetical protein QR721_05165 [Bacillaceae bacterium 44XB]